MLRKVLVDLVLGGGVLVAAGFTAVRLLQLDDSRYTIAALAITPYALAGALLLTLLTLLARRPVLAIAATVLTVLLGAAVLPRMVPNSQPAVSGPNLVAAGANLHYGDGGQADLVDLVRERHVDVLTLEELTPAAVQRMDDAGLSTLLPYRVYYQYRGSSGSGIASRYPVYQRVLTGPSVMQQPAVQVDLPGPNDLEVQLVHPVQPLSRHGVDGWHLELAQLPGPGDGPTPRLLVGDFNSTLDHPTLRRLLDLGYVDAAEQVGAGLLSTWPSRARPWPPHVTLDHVLVDRRCAVRSFDVVAIAGSDHRAIVAELTLPS